jgi:hypothetical protein
VLYKDKPHAGINWKRVKQLLESFQPTCRGTDADNWERKLAGFFARLGRNLPRRQYGSRRFSLPSHVQNKIQLSLSELKTKLIGGHCNGGGENISTATRARTSFA